MQERIDAAAAHICWVVASSAGGKRKWKPKDFMPQWDQAPRSNEPQSDDDMIATMRSLQSRGKRRKRKRKDPS